jgi:hypothetical protein
MPQRVIAVLGLLAAALGACDGGTPSYPELRQAAEQEVPGSWGLVLKPPPGDLDPTISPQRARELALVVPGPGEVFETLALVPGRFVGESAETAAWVVMARDLCFAQSKGDLVSSSRRDPEDVERCSERNIWVEMIDPMTGDSLASLGAYDDTATWVPATSTA